MKNLKKQTNFSSKMVPVGLDFTVAKDTTMVAMHISKSIEVESILQQWQQLWFLVASGMIWHHLIKKLKQ